MNISEAGIRLIEGFEGFSPVLYLDPVGIPTIGYGTTAADINPLPKVCTQAQAEGWLREKLATKYEPAVLAIGVPLNQHQFDALSSLAYNCGPGIVSDAFSIGRDLRARNYAAAGDDFLHYVYAGGRILPGLVRRRNAERALFLAPMPAPPPPPDLHYERFSPVPALVNGKALVERERVQTYDKLARRPKINALRLRGVRADLALLRKLVWTVAHEDAPPSWGVRWRGWRWQELAHRTRQ